MQTPRSSIAGEGQLIESFWVPHYALFGVRTGSPVRFDISMWSDIMPIVDNRQSATSYSPSEIRALDLVQQDRRQIHAKCRRAVQWEEADA